MLWYSREAVLLVHVGEVIVLSGSDQREALMEAYPALGGRGGGAGAPRGAEVLRR